MQGLEANTKANSVNFSFLFCIHGNWNKLQSSSLDLSKDASTYFFPHLSISLRNVQVSDPNSSSIVPSSLSQNVEKYVPIRSFVPVFTDLILSP